MSVGRRWLLYGLSLALIAVAIWSLGPEAEEESSGGVVSRASAHTGTPGAPTENFSWLAIDGLPSRTHDGPAADPFTPRAWLEPERDYAAEERARAALRTPQAPPLPFSYMGRLIRGEDTLVFLTRQDRNLIVRLGDTVEDRYRLDEIGDEHLVLTYLPLQQRQELVFANRASRRSPTPSTEVVTDAATDIESETDEEDVE